MGFDWCCDQVGDGHESNRVKYLLKKSFSEQSNYFVHFQLCNNSKTKNVFECCLLLWIVKFLVFLENAKEMFV